MRNFLTAGIFGVATFLVAQPALAALCGPPADVKTVEQGTVLYFNAHLHGSKKINNTYVMAALVLNTYAQVDVSYSGQASYYWIKKSGVWTFSGTFAPNGWPASVKSTLRKMANQRANGSKQCTNPQFVPRGSG